MCPFCYLGKRKFEHALSLFTGKEYIEVEWKSFQLNPGLVTDPGISIHQYLAEHKGISAEQAAKMNDRLTRAGAAVGLDYHFDKIIVANTFRAHQLLRFARTQGKQNEMEERLFEAYFTNGQNVDDLPTLVRLAGDAGLDTAGLPEAIESNQYAGQVQAELAEAGSLGIQGVPYFLFNRKYVVNGAQESPVFLETLHNAFDDWAKSHPEVKTRPAAFRYKPL